MIWGTIAAFNVASCSISMLRVSLRVVALRRQRQGSHGLESRVGSSGSARWIYLEKMLVTGGMKCVQNSQDMSVSMEGLPRRGMLMKWLQDGQVVGGTARLSPMQLIHSSSGISQKEIRSTRLLSFANRQTARRMIFIP